MRILSIETSCDETSAAVIEGKGDKVKILSNIVSSQINIHKKFGGVVPEVAARNHILNIIPVVEDALKEAFGGKYPPLGKEGIKRSSSPVKWKLEDVGIDLITVTSGPGLMSSLLIGAQTAETLSYTWKKPLININHIEGHIYANWLSPVSKSKVKSQKSKVEFPALALVVSGGHTQLVLMKDHLKYKTIGQTRDDAAGEAFDKVAKILGLGYPGGPIISKMAEKGSDVYNFPRPMQNSNNFDFSFSGLKTAVLYFVKDLPPLTPPCKGGGLTDKIICDISASFQQAAIDVLIHKTIKATKKYKVKSVLLAGGVAANKELKMQLKEAVEKELNIAFYVPEMHLCTDNAAMVGSAAYYRYKKKPSLAKIAPVKIKVDPNWTI